VQPLVSILIPAYNAEEWIAETLDSALAQTWHAKEILVVDDGSTDRTLDIARHFMSRGVRVISQPHQGAAAARNRALSLRRRRPAGAGQNREAIAGCGAICGFADVVVVGVGPLHVPPRTRTVCADRAVV
jgi:glycosyltransferase involved in cell wall biosynthesis